MKTLLLFFILANTLFGYSQSDLKTIGKIEGVTLEKELGVYYLTYDDETTGDQYEIDFKDRGNTLDTIFKFCKIGFIDKPEKGFMLMLDYDTIVLMFRDNKMQILHYVNHYSDKIHATKFMTFEEVNKLFGKPIDIKNL